MRVAFAGVSHWHIKFFEQTVAALPDVDLVAVSDSDPEKAKAFGARVGVPDYDDYRRMCESVEPDFVFALGRHSEMAATGEYLVEAGIPFALEKPCGTTYAQVRRLADLAEAKGAFASATFGFHHTGMRAKIREHAGDERLEFMSLRAIGGSPMRYDLNGPWVLDPAESGGGPLINLGIHYLQLFRSLVGDARVTVRSAATSNRTYGLPVEDYVVVVLEADGALGVIETGYSYPGPGGDEHFSIRTSGHYFTLTGTGSEDLRVADVASLDAAIAAADLPTRLRLYDSPDMGGHVRVEKTDSRRFPAAWTSDVLARVREGRPPAEDMHDMAECVRLVEEAYRLAGPPPLLATDTQRYRAPEV
jgi:predicted dehydrogenase